MASTIQRPQFAEGEVLHADDLNEGFEQSRSRDARHVRQSHRWGIVEGLEIAGAASAVGFEVTVKKGVARDIRGREIVVTEDQPVPRPAFTVSGSSKDLQYPVFLSAQDDTSQKNQLASISQAQAGARLTETFKIEVGRAAEAEDWETNQEQAAPDEGPDPSAAQDRPKVLVGFVALDELGNFTAADKASKSGKVPRRGGARADVVESSDGNAILTLGASKDKILSVKSGKGDDLLTVTTKGDLSIVGKLISSHKHDLHFVSGVAFDGAKLPLPAGIAEEDLQSFDLHVMLSPLHDFSVVRVPECRMDSDRQLQCLAIRGDATMTSWAASFLVVLEPQGEA